MFPWFGEDGGGGRSGFEADGVESREGGLVVDVHRRWGGIVARRCLVLLLRRLLLR